MSRQSFRPPSLFAVGIVVTTLGTATACTRGAPAAPDLRDSFSLRSTAIDPAGRSALTFDLRAGRFTLSFGNGSITGTYSGQASVPASGPRTSSLQLTVTGGTGLFAGATGTLSGDGAGHFVDEGEFSLSLKGSISPSNPPNAPFRATLSGRAVVSCVQNVLRITLHGDGVGPRVGAAGGDFGHDVGNAGCTF